MELIVTTLHVAYELSPPEHRFFTSDLYPERCWYGFSSIPRTSLERIIRRPKFSRYRAAFEVVRSAARSDDPVIISHMPVLSQAVESVNRMSARRIPHIAFAFNYTTLPISARRRFAKEVFESIGLFVVFSSFERQLYHEYFSIPLEKLVYVPWTQSPPPVGELDVVPYNGDYFCAVGGEARDYGVLIEAAKVVGINLVIVARPYSLADLTWEENVRVFSNIPLDMTWALASSSKGMVLPLLSTETCCGHITAVSAMMLGIPILMARAKGLSDYIHLDVNPLTYEPRSVAELVVRLTEFRDASDKFNDISKANMSRFVEIYARNVWAPVIENCIDRVSF